MNGASGHVAIVGIACRFPGARNRREYWRLLAEGIDAISESRGPDDIQPFPGGYLPEVDAFDAELFRIPPREAEKMDPQQRLLLELTWQVFLDAGIPPEAGAPVGVFVGSSTVDYGRMMFEDAGRVDAYANTGASPAIMANRISYVFNFRGPSLTVDTACSSSLAAAHLAVNAINRGEASMALVGGVNLILDHSHTLGHEKTGYLARDGRCKPFDARADGFVRGEGGGMLLLRPLEDAVAAGDYIHGVIAGGAMNQDGRSNGMLAPYGPSQREVIKAAWRRAGLSPEQAGYVEAHGTGTALGDMIEATSLGAVVGEREEGHECAIGSVKGNIGHTEAAAGMAGLIKALLMLDRRELVPSIHCEEPNPRIHFKKLGLRVQQEREPWPADENGRLFAGVSSFGFGGTNVHLVLQNAPEVLSSSNDSPMKLPGLLALSAHSPDALDAWATVCAENFAANSNLDSNKDFESKSDFEETIVMAANLSLRSARMNERLTVSYHTARELRDSLRSAAAGELRPGVARGRVVPGPFRLAFVFSGQVARNPDLVRGLFADEPVFRATLEHCDATSRGLGGPGLPADVGDGAGDEHGVDTESDTQATQLLLFAVQMGLVELWKSLGIEPEVVVGHSLGEFAAAVTSGAMRLETGLELVLIRGRLMRAMAGRGVMLAAELSPQDAHELIGQQGDKIALAAVNASHSAVLSGEIAVMSSVARDLERRGIFFRELNVHGIPSHSPLMREVADEFVESIRKVRAPEAARIPFYSTVLGEQVQGEALTGEYWARNLAEPVQFKKASEAIIAAGVHNFLEIGLHSVLVGPLREALAAGGKQGLAAGSLNRNVSHREGIRLAQGALWTAGAPLDLSRLYPDALPRRSLPDYAFQRKSYWFKTEKEPSLPIERILDAARARALLFPRGSDPDGTASRTKILARLADLYIIKALIASDCFRVPGELLSLRDVLSRVRVLPAYRRLTARRLESLRRNNFLTVENGRYRAKQKMRELSETVDRDIEACLHEARDFFEHDGHLLEFSRNCGENLVGILKGEITALEMLFPGGSFATANALYNESPVPRYFNGIAAAVVETISINLPRKRNLRVLEVGAGTGGTTAAVLPCLPPDRTGYTFTDLSEFFLGRAREKFADFPFVDYGILDIEKSPASQGFVAGAFDLVIAANSIHAVRDLPESVAYLRELLSPGGMLLLYETTTHHDFFDITTGLIEGWQRFRDPLRRDNPLLAAGDWESLLLENGFSSAHRIPGPETELGQHIILGCTGERFQAGDQGTSRLEASFGSGSESETRELTSRVSREGGEEESVHEFLSARVQNLLGVNKAIDSERALKEYGFDSLMAVELRRRILDRYGINLPLASVDAQASLRDLAQALDVDSGAEKSPSAIEGDSGTGASFPLTPIQLTFFDQELVEPHLWNAGFHFHVPDGLSPDDLERAFAAVYKKHEALRLHFVREHDVRVQLVDDARDGFRFVHEVLPMEPGEDAEERILEISREYQRDFNLEQGPLCALFYFNFSAPPGKEPPPGRILFICHHLICDGYSVHLIMKDLQELCFRPEEQNRTTQTFVFGYSRWAAHLEARRREGPPPEEVGYWGKFNSDEYSSLRPDFPMGSEAEARAEGIVRAWEPKLVERFFRRCVDLGLSRERALIGAVIIALRRRLDSNEIMVDLEKHGRESEMDVSHVAGWFNIRYPLYASIPEGDIVEQLRALSEQMERVPSGGRGYGLWNRGSNSALPTAHEKPRPTVKILYHGNLGERIDAALREFRFAPEKNGSYWGERNAMNYELFVYLHLEQGRLVSRWVYSKDRFRAASMEQLATGFEECLSEIY